MKSAERIHDVIVAPATPPGVSALAVIRLSGHDSIRVVQRVFAGKNLEEQPTHTLHLGLIKDGDEPIDEVMISVFREPNSFTKENSVEISCHGSQIIVQRIISVLIKNGATLAGPGEFTKRAFLNGRFDLAQAEAVADLIASETDNARLAALNQMRGGFSKEIQKLREELIHFASLIELELDFGEEDVEFAKRDDLKKLIQKIQSYLLSLIESFRQGNVIKSGVPTVIAGKPNAGKSTLLNVLLKEEKAIVSEIAGTTRDVIEDEMVLDGINFRFIDTAGLRDTTDTIEAIGVERTKAQLKKAALVLYVVDLSNTDIHQVKAELKDLESITVPVIRIGNKMDKAAPALLKELEALGFIFISATNKTNLQQLHDRILSNFHINHVKQGDVIITNLRHYKSLQDTNDALNRVLAGMDKGVTGDFLAMDVRNALHHLGLITGQISTEDLLENIFSKFCIGK
ncbi:MAG TPA: tRNA uridine-5-carboxymethylaminomethyl(34) synthesis GTPase MnmE [Cyclobacteriaceae bacterium]|nr:tRNA uridine-5-carboxymethylaminomethyl(34) synthesis GTPase MnmE [Cyclobacteriaceae bacterium]